MSKFYEHNQEYEALAFSILSEIGAIKTCDLHDDYYYSTGMDEQKVYALATNKLKELKCFSDSKLFHSFIKTILAEAGSSASDCPFCEKAMAE